MTNFAETRKPAALLIDLVCIGSRGKFVGSPGPSKISSLFGEK